MDAVAARIGSGGWKEFQVADIVPVPRRTTAHDHKQLAEALGWTRRPGGQGDPAWRHPRAVRAEDPAVEGRHR
jgi:hypothetical protein